MTDTPTLTPAILDEIAAALAEATPGDWEVDGCRVEAWRDSDLLMKIFDEGGHTEADARFIAIAHNHAPALLALAREGLTARALRDGAMLAVPHERKGAVIFDKRTGEIIIDTSPPETKP